MNSYMLIIGTIFLYAFLSTIFAWESWRDPKDKGGTQNDMESVVKQMTAVKNTKEGNFEQNYFNDMKYVSTPLIDPGTAESSSKISGKFEKMEKYFNIPEASGTTWRNVIRRHRHAHNKLHHRSLPQFSIYERDLYESLPPPPTLWPVKKEAIVEGSVVLGGLMMVHEREDNRTCGPIMPQGGIQALEVMLYTLDKINQDNVLMPNVKIGAHILDDCDKDTYGLEMAVDFIKGESSDVWEKKRIENLLAEKSRWKNSLKLKSKNNFIPMFDKKIFNLEFIKKVDKILLKILNRRIF